MNYKKCSAAANEGPNTHSSSWVVWSRVWDQCQKRMDYKPKHKKCVCSTS